MLQQLPLEAVLFLKNLIPWPASEIPWPASEQSVHAVMMHYHMKGRDVHCKRYIQWSNAYDMYFVDKLITGKEDGASYYA